MGWFESREVKENKSHFKNLLEVAAIDGEIADHELAELFGAGFDWGLTERQMREVLKSPSKIKFLSPVSDEKGRAQLVDLLRMALADGKVTENEYDYCQTLAVRLGFSAGSVPTLLNAIIEQVRSEAKPEVNAAAFLAG